MGWSYKVGFLAGWGFYDVCLGGRELDGFGRLNYVGEEEVSIVG